MLEEVKDKLKKYGQEHLIKFYDELSEEEKMNLLEQINKIDFEQVNKLYEDNKINSEFKDDRIEPMRYIDKDKLTEEEKEGYSKIGYKIISSGEYAVVTMAGGQGSRLGHNGPKGTFELLPGKSLFEILCDELKRANSKYNTIIPWYIMTSKANNDDTIKFFEGNNYFGYPKENIEFFVQGELPMIDTNGKIILETKGKIKEGADGNGGIFGSMIKSGVLEDMHIRGIKWVFIGSIDNAILKLADSLFLGLTVNKQMLAASKTIAKASPEERVGVFCKRNGKPSVIEYSELPQNMAVKRDDLGELIFGEAHIMCNLFSTHILERIGKEKLPYHRAFKKSDYINENGELIEATEPNAYKFESFIFDAFSLLDEILLMRAKRDEEFAPVKNAQGADSPETARQLYLRNNQ